MTQKENKSSRDSEWENRTLCSDESCIGTIGPDGCCRECGLPYDGKLTQTGPQTQTEADTLPDTPEPAEDASPVASSAEEESPFDESDWNDRTLCRDESCIGVIGPDGRCPECGLPFSEE